MSGPGGSRERGSALVLDHIGILVADLDAATALVGTMFGYAPATRPVVNTRQQVRVVFLEKPGSLPLKLFESLAPGRSPARNAAATLHHLAFRTDDLPGTLEDLESRGARILVPPQPGEAFDNEPIAFVHVGMGLNTELITTDKRAERLGVDPSGGGSRT